MTKEQLVNRVHLMLREHGSVYYRRLENSDTAVFEGEIPVGDIVDMFMDIIEEARADGFDEGYKEGT